MPSNNSKYTPEVRERTVKLKYLCMNIGMQDPFLIAVL